MILKGLLSHYIDLGLEAKEPISKLDRVLHILFKVYKSAADLFNVWLHLIENPIIL